MKNIIHIYGASGSGTSTLGRKICDELGYRFMDTDDYFWLPTNPKYTTKRSKDERIKLMRNDIEEAENVVISGSLVDWGDELISLFTLVIRLETDTLLRIERLRQRERQKFGSRIEIGGDMYENHKEFIEWASAYDTGSIDMRSKAKHDEWQKLLKCKQIVLNGADDLEYNYNVIRNELYNVIGKIVTVTIDRPLGTYHPIHKDMYYPINYGYIEGIMAADGEEQDAYIIGIDVPINKFTGKVIAVVHRKDDIEDKWIVCPEDMNIMIEEIKEKIHFQEQYFDSQIII
jgi:adenylate kinase family enzyme